MTQVDFYSPVPDKIALIHTLCKKAQGKGWRTMLWLRDEAHAAEVSGLLWQHPPTGFLPHVAVAHPLASNTPLLLATRQTPTEGNLPHHDMLINLTDAPPSIFARFERVVELVGPNEEEKLHYRDQYRWYKQHGYPLNFYQLDK
ncbi:DNA polymerase III subunit chi [Leeia sp. TBRC 13508]|uniref:DNA polymerase III subunit chi n=1 Tax=Leeia speluncae TaxID=2884804 RepID=A0ABS8D750_9NEIS|nr:DNA polymerase III subunit chi [Leeia speluncae]MCB6184021.1 DNA polymerase III subunit chi [Leeia speluncae]